MDENVKNGYREFDHSGTLSIGIGTSNNGRLAEMLISLNVMK